MKSAPTIVPMMFSDCLFLLHTLLVSFASSSTFYDNPEQDAVPLHEPETLESLHQKWDFEVPSNIPFPEHLSLTSSTYNPTVGLLRHLHLRPPPPHQMPLLPHHPL